MLACPADAQSQQDGTGPRTGYDNFLAVQVYAVGGGFIPFGTNSNVTGVDATVDPSNLLIANQSGGSSSTTPLLGARVHVPLLWNMYDEQRLAFSVFFETGLQSGFASQSFIQTFQNTSFFAGDFGSSTVTEYYQIPSCLDSLYRLRSVRLHPTFCSTSTAASRSTAGPRPCKAPK
jgi:hypothetical protein